MTAVLHALLLPAATLGPEVTHALDDDGDPAVVAVVDAQGVTGCTGTVIAPHIVLTAAHCIVPALRTGARCVFGQSVQSPAASVPIRGFRVDPAYDGTTHVHDAAILVLGAAAPTPAMAVGSTAPAVGDTLLSVGWGLTAAGAADAGHKRMGTMRVSSLDALTFSVTGDPSQPCEGDSGGPALASGAGGQTTVGITSFGDAACDQSATYTRVDVEVASFISPTVAAFEPGQVPTGGACLFPEQCAGGATACVVAVDDPNVAYCTASCSADADCATGMLCVAIPDHGHQCRYPVPSPGAMGSTCGTDLDCAETSCLQGLCTQACSAISGVCPAGFACASADGVEYVCAPDAPSVSGSACALAASRGDPDGWIAAALGATTALLARKRARAAAGRRTKA